MEQLILTQLSTHQFLNSPPAINSVQKTLVHHSKQ